MDTAFSERLLSTVEPNISPGVSNPSPTTFAASSVSSYPSPPSSSSSPGAGARGLGSPYAQSPLRSPYSSPYKSPSSQGSSRENYYDRFIPSRVSPCYARKCLFGSPKTLPTSLVCSSKKKKDSADPPRVETLTYQSVLQNELLNKNITEVQDPQAMERNQPLRPVSPSKDNIFKYQSSPRKLDTTAPYSTSPVSKSSNKLLLSPRRMTRKISKIPYKVLDAPELQDDFYLNLLDWSSQNVLSVGLGTAVYLWSACTCQVSKLCDLIGEGDSVTSVAWSERGQYLAVGTQSGPIQIWDAAAEKRICNFNGHTGRVGALSWNRNILCSGSRDQYIFQWDHRNPIFPMRNYEGHTHEVCGLKWSPDHQLLASGGNDNKLIIWTPLAAAPVRRHGEHKAAVKAISWSPHQHGILASGGGTADRSIRFWNTLTGQPLQHIYTGSQVCNLVWSKSTNEIVSTHGYSMNQLIIWRYPALTQVARLNGHSTRVLYLAMSPDGQTVVTGAGDETLRFWNVFNKSKSHKEPNSPLDMAAYIR